MDRLEKVLLHALWCKIIKSIHGFNEGLSLSNTKSGTWKHISNLDKELLKVNINLMSFLRKEFAMDKELVFGTTIGFEISHSKKNMYPRLFQLES